MVLCQQLQLHFMIALAPYSLSGILSCHILASSRGPMLLRLHYLILLKPSSRFLKDWHPQLL